MPPLTFPSPVVAGRSSVFTGKGLFAPLREDAVTGDFQRIEGEANVAQCLRDGILTAIGERVMAEPLGTIARKLLFEESEIVADLLEPSIRDFVERFEPRVILQSVSVTPTELGSNVSAFKCSVVYVVRETNTRKNLVFPFSLESTGGP